MTLTRDPIGLPDQGLRRSGLTGESAQADFRARMLESAAGLVGCSLDFATVAQRIAELFAAALGQEDACVHSFDSETEELRLVAATMEGAMDGAGEVGVPLGEGVLGAVASARQGRWIGRGASSRGTGDRSPAMGKDYDGLVCVPIIATPDQLIAIATVWVGSERDLTAADDLPFAERLASVVANPLWNAELYAGATDRARTVERLAEVTALTTSGIPTVRTLTGLTEVAADVSEAGLALMLISEPHGGERLMVRATGSVSASGDADLGHQVRRELLAIEADIRRDDTAWAAAAEDVSARLEPWYGVSVAVPLRIAGEQLGVLCCFRAEARSFAAEDLSLLTMIAGQSALALKNAQLSERLTEQRNEFGHFLRNLTSGRLDAQALRDHAAALGLDSRGSYRFLVATILADTGSDPHVSTSRQIAQRLAKIAPGVRCSAGARGVVALIDAQAGEAEPTALRARLAKLQAALAKTATVTISISEPTLSLSDFRATLAEAREVAAVAAAAGSDGGVFTRDDVSQELMLRRAAGSSSGKDRYGRAIETIAEYDRLKRGSLLHTLRVFLDHRNRSDAARILYVHRNTLSQRLRRIEELSGVTVTDPDEWFPLQLALKIHLLQHPDEAGQP
jgi:DNA-binding PucR family transcriptional regulator